MNEQAESFFQEILRSETINVRCNGCGTDQIMNAAYVKYVQDGLRTCGNCRKSNK